MPDWRWRTDWTGDIANALLETGADVDARDEDGYTPLHYAAEYGKAVDILLGAGANAKIRTKDGQAYQMLHDASWRPRTTLILDGF